MFTAVMLAISCTTPAQDAGHAGEAAPDSGAPLRQDTCRDGGTDAMAAPPSSGGIDAVPSTQVDAGPSVTGGAEICRSEWPQSGGLLVSHVWLATDTAGDSYVALDYGDNRPLTDDAGPPPQLDLGAPSPRVSAGFAVAKFDDACHLVWVREFGPSGALYSDGAEAVAIRTDAASNVTILGDFFGSVDFGAGTLTAGPDIENGVLLRLDSTGKTVFSTQFVNTRSGTGTAEYDLAVTPGGISTIALDADSDTDFGSGKDTASIFGVQSSNDLVQFDANGKVLFRRTVPSIESSVGMVFNLATNSSGFLWTVGSTSSILAANASPRKPLTMGVTASGAFAWQQADDTEPVIAAGPDGAVELTFAPVTPGGSTQIETLRALAASGSSPWTASTTISNSAYGGRMVIDANGAPVVSGWFQGTVTFGSAPPLTSAGGADIDYQAFDGAGHLGSAGAWGGPDDDYSDGIGVDPAGNILIAGTSTPPMSDTTSRVFFVKLAR